MLQDLTHGNCPDRQVQTDRQLTSGRQGLTGRDAVTAQAFLPLTVC